MRTRDFPVCNFQHCKAHRCENQQIRGHNIDSKLLLNLPEHHGHISFLSPSRLETKPEISLPSISPPKIKEPNEAMVSALMPDFVPAK